MPNVVLGAHLAGTTYDTFFRRAEFAFENIQGIWEGAAPMAVVSDTSAVDVEPHSRLREHQLQAHERL